MNTPSPRDILDSQGSTDLPPLIISAKNPPPVPASNPGPDPSVALVQPQPQMPPIPPTPPPQPDPQLDNSGGDDEDEQDDSEEWDEGSNSVRDNLEESAKRYWRPLAAYTYIIICLFDFIAMPVFTEVHNRQVNTQAFVEVSKLTSPEVQIKAIEQLNLGEKDWLPLTLEGGGLFHIAFGAILGVAAWTRGQEKRAALQFNGSEGRDWPPGMRNGGAHGRPGGGR